MGMRRGSHKRERNDDVKCDIITAVDFGKPSELNSCEFCEVMQKSDFTGKDFSRTSQFRKMIMLTIIDLMLYIRLFNVQSVVVNTSSTSCLVSGLHHSFQPQASVQSISDYSIPP